jgi:2',3'-cyclic-nucleotide 2'-phosphodiesterase (5'-nucleotidase family)
MIVLTILSFSQTNKPDSVITKWNEVIGRTNVDLTRALEEESLIHNLVCDLLLHRIEADICILDYYSIHGMLPAGDITHLDMFRLFPFDREIVTFDIKGEQLKEILEFKLSGLRKGLMLGGARFEYDPNRASNSRLTYFEIGGFPFYPERVYRVVTISYLVQGNAGFDLMSRIKFTDLYYTGLFLRDIIIEQIKEHSPIDIKADGRRRKL